MRNFECNFISILISTNVEQIVALDCLPYFGPYRLGMVEIKRSDHVRLVKF